jgi:DNA invertase Pin-like site-specific DNA recombinase
MSTNGARAAIYLRVSRDGQTTENQRLVLAKVAEHRGWVIVQTYEDQGISGAKGRDQRPAFDTMLKDAVRRRFDVLMVWSIDRLGRSVLNVANSSPNSMLLAWRSIPTSRPSTARPRWGAP